MRPLSPKNYIIVRSIRVRVLLIWFSLFLVPLHTSIRGQDPGEGSPVSGAIRIILEGKALHDRGTAEGARQAIAKFEEARKIYHEEGDVLGEGSILVIIAEVYSKSLGEHDKALDSLNRAMPLIRAGKNKISEAVLLTLTGDLQSVQGEKQKAIESYKAARAVFREVKDEAGEAKTLNNWGVVLLDLGNVNQALEVHRQAFEISTRLDDLEGKALSLANIGRAYFELGDFQKALEVYAQSLPFLRGVSDKKLEITALNNMGLAYGSIGDKTRARQYFEQALAFAKSIDHRISQVNALLNIGSIYREDQENSKAIDYYEKALSVAREVADKRGESRALANLGNLSESLGKSQEALALFDRALQLMEALDDSNGKASVLISMAVLRANRGEAGTAKDFLERSLKLVDTTGNLQLRARTLREIAAVERDLGKLDEARRAIDAALALVETLRGKYTNQDFQTRYFASARDYYYGFYINLLMDLHQQFPRAGFQEVALEASERARARSLLDLLVEAGADIQQGVDPQLLEQAQSVQQLLDSKAERRVRLLSGPHTKEQAKAAAREIESLTTEYQEIESKIRQRSPRYAALTQPKPLRLKAIQQELDPRTLLLEYSLGDERSYLWLVSSTQIKSFALPSRKEIETAARKYYELLTLVTDPEHDETIAIGARLSEMLLGPVAPQLTTKRLVIVADGALQFVPFAALPDPSSNRLAAEVAPLIIQHEIVSLPSISVLALLRSELAGRKPPSKQLAVLADPVFYWDDERVKKNPRTAETGEPKSGSDVDRTVGGARPNEPLFNRLLGTRKEAEEIIGLVPVDKRKIALDFAASRELVNSGELSQYRYVHFATHGRIDSVHPELTAIVLSLVNQDGNPQNGFLRAHEVYNLKLPADLVVLSGCETALGEDVKGEGMIGLTRGFMYAGAPRVVASLWAVRDDSTAKLMVDFYRGMIKDRKRPAEALRAAQLEMLKNERWRAPHYWAPFVIQGEWR